MLMNFIAQHYSKLVTLIMLLGFTACVYGQTDTTLKYPNGMVVCAYPDAAQAGLDVLKKGGNAVDAAVAVQFALAVTHPQAGNIGGGGFIVYPSAQSQTTTLHHPQ